MKPVLLALILIELCNLSFGQSIPKTVNETDFVIGKSVTISSDILKEERKLNIYLPSSYYNNQSNSYPVIYLLDGSKDEDFIHIAGLVQFGSFSWINLIPESIVVGIGNTDRKKDFTYLSSNQLDQKEFPTSGHSSDFIAFIEKELQPYVQSNLRVNAQKTLIGQSLGGLLATEILFKKPDLFNHYIIVSPSLWWDNEQLLAYKTSNIAAVQSIYIGVGKEGEVMERTARELYSKLKFEKAENTFLFFDFLANKTHGDALHQAVYNAFEKVFRVRKD